MKITVEMMQENELDVELISKVVNAGLNGVELTQDVCMQNAHKVPFGVLGSMLLPPLQRGTFKREARAIFNSYEKAVEEATATHHREIQWCREGSRHMRRLLEEFNAFRKPHKDALDRELAELFYQLSTEA